MDDYSLSSKELRTLRRMRNRDRVPEDEIYNCYDLYIRGFIEANTLNECDSLNAPIPDGTFRLSEKYWRYIREHRWFTWEYVLSHLIVPIAVAVLAAIITARVIGK